VKFLTAILTDGESEGVSPYIMGGTAATIQNFPFMASIRVHRNYIHRFFLTENNSLARPNYSSFSNAVI
jgi:secreted trypsin-like serine protease